jgi:DNA uptake protein ComE-like DNA-binding protein
MKRALLYTSLLLTLTACTTQRTSPTPDQIREQTAKATKEVAQDAKAVVQGVAEGIHQKGPVNINKASADDLKSLPGIDDETAQRIIANRPYTDSGQILKRHLVSHTEYNQISTRITAQ